MRQQGDERHLPDIRRLTRHVRTGQQGDLLAGTGETGVVRHERPGPGTSLQHAFDDGVTPLLYFQDVGIIDDRLTPVGFASQVGPTAQDIDFGHDKGRGEQRFGAGDDLRQQRLEKFGLSGERLLIGAEHLAFLGTKFFGGEAFGVHHGLLADIIRRDGGQVGLGDLDGITEGAIVTDLQGLDAGAVLLVALEIRDPALAVRSERAKAVELRIEAGAQGAPFGQVDREFIAKRGLQTSQQSRLGLDAHGQCGERATG